MVSYRVIQAAMSRLVEDMIVVEKNDGTPIRLLGVEQLRLDTDENRRYVFRFLYSICSTYQPDKRTMLLKP